MTKFRHLSISHLFVIWILTLGITLGFILHELWPQKPAAAKLVTIRSRNLEYQVETRAGTLEDFLIGQGYVDRHIVVADTELSQGVVIQVSPLVKVTFVDGGNGKQIETTAETVGDLLYEEQIGLAETDQIKPPLGTFLADNMTINIDRIVDLEVTELAETPYAIKLEHDPDMLYGREDMLVPGVVGKKEQKFLITYKNGVEVNRKLLEEKVLAEPQTEIRKMGTKIEIEETTEGRTSWYATKVCLSAFGGCAAHPFYEFGRYVRVTSLISGKSIIVKVNDRGPNQSIHPERIIDLDSVAFRELASLGAGTIPVRVELLK